MDTTKQVLLPELAVGWKQLKLGDKFSNLFKEQLGRSTTGPSDVN
jgi:hypothetical protein